jgi:hypothetical protein
MSAIRILSFGSVFAVLLATGGYAAEQGYSPGTSEQDYSTAPHARTHQHAGFRRYGMTRELKVLWRTEMPKGHHLRNTWAAMTDAQKTAKVAELRAKWSSLDPRVRDAIAAKIRYKKAVGNKRGARTQDEMQELTPQPSPGG